MKFLLNSTKMKFLARKTLLIQQFALEFYLLLTTLLCELHLITALLEQRPSCEWKTTRNFQL